jgi:hypothetical protein
MWRIDFYVQNSWLNFVLFVYVREPAATHLKTPRPNTHHKNTTPKHNITKQRTKLATDNNGPNM